MTLQERLRAWADEGGGLRVRAEREAADRIDELEAALRDMLDGVAGCRKRARDALGERRNNLDPLA